VATKLFLRLTQNNGITDTGDGIVYDLLTAQGDGANTAVVSTAASGTNIQWTITQGGLSIAWITGRVPAGGFTLTTTDISAWCHESNMNANAGGRYRLYRYQPGPTITELGGGPFDDGVEFGTAATEMLWTGNPTDQAFSENDRLLLRMFITNIGTMGGGFNCTLTFDALDATTGDSFLNLAETVVFKPEDVVNVFFENRHPIVQGMKPNTAAGMGGVIIASGKERFEARRRWCKRGPLYVPEWQGRRKVAA
jgi:hypothetical protein